MSDNEKDMRAEYDFSKGERGKFYRPGMTITISVRVRLGQASVKFLEEKAKKKGVSLEDLAADILETEVGLNAANWDLTHLKPRSAPSPAPPRGHSSAHACRSEKHLPRSED